ncbi:MAG: hypothetical protein Q7S34_03570 [bacterium]|nr:hypothetical protein [bacterium]
MTNINYKEINQERPSFGAIFGVFIAMPNLTVSLNYPNTFARALGQSGNNT